jgi:tetratricopeptide (TPR) repeat protein
MSQILPGRFLADLCWQQLTMPLISLQLFLLWLIFNALVGGRIALASFRRGDREQILHMVLVLSSFFFMFFALFRISVNWMGMQFRHVWSLWPVTLLAPYFAIKGLKFLKRVNRETILSIIFAGLMTVLVPVNFLILYNYILMYKTIERVSRPDLDYFTFSDYYAQSPQIASAYLDRTIFTDVVAYNYFAQRDDWDNALFYARRALQKGGNERESRLMCVRALRSLGKHREALEVLRKGADDSHRTRLLEVGILVDLGRFSEARELIGRCLPEAPPDVRVQLESILKKIRAKPEDN